MFEKLGFIVLRRLILVKMVYLVPVLLLCGVVITLLSRNFAGAIVLAFLALLFFFIGLLLRRFAIHFEKRRAS